MGLVLTNYPTTVLSPAYNDMCFELEGNVVNGNKVAVVEAKIYIDGVLQEPTPLFQPVSYRNDAGTVADFKINVSEYVQCVFDNTETLCEPGVSFSSGSATGYHEYYVEFCLYEVDQNKCQVLEGSTVTTQTYVSFNGACPWHEYKDADLTSQFMTNKPDKTIVCPGESEWLCYFSFSGGGSGTIVWYNGATQIATTSFSIPGQPLTVSCLNVGPSAFENSGAAVNLENATHYFVIVPFIAPRVYYIDKSCCTKYRIHFLNKWGTYDSLSITQNVKESYSTSSVLYQQSLPKYQQDLSGNFGDNITRARGANRLFSKGTTICNVSSQNMNKATRQWLKELYRSPSVYVETEDRDYIAVYVKDKSHTILDSSRRINEVKFDLYYSVDDYSQRS